jgi:signal transduction histidine kinase
MPGMARTRTRSVKKASSAASGRPTRSRKSSSRAAARLSRKPSAADASAILAHPAAAPPDITLRQLAHELNSLLDGSMRCVGLARISLQNGDGGADRKGADSADDGLGKALGAMKHMAALLQRAMRLTVDAAAVSTVAVFHTQQTLGETVDEIAHIMGPLAAAHHVALEVELAQSCAPMPAGPLGVVLLNGLRNAIESCSHRSDAGERRVHLTIGRDDDGQTLHVTIEDTGVAGGAQHLPEVRGPESHGIGLGLSQQIVRELGGEVGLLLRRPPLAAGASLRVCVPVRSLNTHG